MKDLITKEIEVRAAELRKEEAYRLGKMEGYQAGIDEAIADYQTNYEQKHIAEAVKLVRDEVVEMLKKNYIEPIPEANGSDIDDYMRGYNTALDDTIKALKDK